MNKLIGFVLVMLVAGCKEKFVSPAPPVVTGFLVVEGIINNGGGLTTLRLSRTTDLADNSNVAEKGATVTLERSNNNSLPLFEVSDGNYIIDNLDLDTSQQYRLAIKTANNEEYLSDFASVRNNPPIDSINWVRDNNGVQLFINTHDPQNNTHYYQWEYQETWEFHSGLGASLKYITVNNHNIGVEQRVRTDPEIYTCYQFNNSNLLLLGSSAKLTSDIIHLPLISIASKSWKLGVLYSVLVKQYSWTKEGYEFLERMKKNTESVGTVFDAQPSELNGNIHCISNPNQPVIGFFNICTVREKRIFIRNSELPGWGYYLTCQDEIIENIPDSIAKKGVGKLPTVVQIESPFGIISFRAGPEDCVDCRLRGTNVKPSYWP